MEIIELHLHTNMSEQDGVTTIDEYCKRAKEMEHIAIAITDHNCVQSFYSAHEAGQKYDIKIIYGVELLMWDDTFSAKFNKKFEPIYHTIALAKNKQGINELYELLTLANTKHLHDGEAILPKSVINKYRTNLLIGSACFNGEVFDYASQIKDEEVFEKICSFYDYLEIQPPSNYSHLINMYIEKYNEKSIKDTIVRIINSAKRLGKLVVATGDVHYLDKVHKISRDVLIDSQIPYTRLHPLTPKERNELEYFENPDQHFRSTKEMLASFSFLEEELANEIVIKNTNLINDMISQIMPYALLTSYPIIKNANKTLSEICFNKAREKYGDLLPREVKKRMKEELDDVINKGYSSVLLIYYQIAKLMKKYGYLFIGYKKNGSSFLAYLLGISNVNPLCPVNGFIPYNADDSAFYLKVEEEGHLKALQYLRENFGEDNVVKGGKITPFPISTAINMTKKTLGWKEIDVKTVSDEEVRKIALYTAQTKRITMPHISSIFILPEGRKWHEFTPLQYYLNNDKYVWKMTHFDHNDLRKSLYEFNIIADIYLYKLRNLMQITGVNINNIDINEQRLMDIVSGADEVTNLGIPHLKESYKDAERSEHQRISLLFAFFKLYHPLAFYVDYFNMIFYTSLGLAKEEPLLLSKEQLKKRIDDLKLKPSIKYTADMLYLKLYEMMLDMNNRGFTFEKMKIGKNFTREFEIDEPNKRLRPIMKY